MRLERVLSAVAIVLSLLLPATPMVAADDGPNVTIVAPSEGERITAHARVTVDVSGFAGSSVGGHFALDGAWAGNFSAFLPPTNSTTRVNGTLNATSFAPGTYTLTATLGDGNETATSPGVTVILNAPPTLAGNATYDEGTRALHVLLNVSDDSGLAPAIRVRSGNASANASFLGESEIVVPMPRPTGNYTARVEANDTQQNTTIFLAFEVEDRAGIVDVLEARYIRGGQLRVSATFGDPDGAVIWAFANTSMGSGPFEPPNNESPSWVAQFPIAPEVGDHTGYITLKDAWGGITIRHFHFSIDATRETFYEREVDTHVGGFADVQSIYIPFVREGVIEICMVECAPHFGVVDRACAMVGSPCRTADSPWQQSMLGAFRFCRPDPHPPSTNVAGYLAYAFHSALDNATGGALCGAHPVGSVSNGTAIVTVVDGAVPGPGVVCRAAHADAECAFQTTPGGSAFHIAWTQAPDTRVVVRITGVRV